MTTTTRTCCFFCGGTDTDSPEPWIRAPFLDFEPFDGLSGEAWVCSRGRDAYTPGEPLDELPDMNTCRGSLLDAWVEHNLTDAERAERDEWAKRYLTSRSTLAEIS